VSQSKTGVAALSIASNLALTLLELVVVLYIRQQVCSLLETF